ncbi:MAG: hypothetical protein LDL53_10510 [Candidatus Hydrogenedens sp.]|nr:hypothetical protein [Candidatus Hydrogenedens sp.]
MTFAELYDIIYTHLLEHWQTYAIIAVFMVPIIFLTRKWSLPLIFYGIESCIYFVIMHIIVHYFVALVVWFKVNTDMKMLREEGKPPEVPDWGTPLIDFWNKNSYIPPWIAYVEIVFVILILLLVFKYRPPKLGPVKSKRAKIREEHKTLIRKEFEEKKAKYMDDIMP